MKGARLSDTLGQAFEISRQHKRGLIQRLLEGAHRFEDMGWPSSDHVGSQHNTDVDMLGI